MEVEADVPLDAFYKTWHMSSRLDKRYYSSDLISDILSGGGSSTFVPGIGKRKTIVQQHGMLSHGSVDTGTCN